MAVRLSTLPPGRHVWPGRLQELTSVAGWDGASGGNRSIEKIQWHPVLESMTFCLVAYNLKSYASPCPHICSDWSLFLMPCDINIYMLPAMFAPVSVECRFKAFTTVGWAIRQEIWKCLWFWEFRTFWNKIHPAIWNVVLCDMLLCIVLHQRFRETQRPYFRTRKVSKIEDPEGGVITLLRNFGTLLPEYSVTSQEIVLFVVTTNNHRENITSNILDYAHTFNLLFWKKKMCI
jgi:hypothetical protein